MLLDESTIESMIGNARVDHKHKNIYGECPWCGKNEFGISLEDNHPFRCFRGNNCGETGNIFKLLKYLGKTELFQNKDFYRKTDIFSTLYKVSFDKEEVESSIDLEEIQKPIGFRRVYEHPYLANRGFTANQFNKYEIGITNIYLKLKGYVVFIIKEGDKIVGYVSRNTKSKHEIDSINKKNKESGLPQILRYINSTTDFSKTLYGSNEISQFTESVLIVEGLFDKINIEIIAPELNKNGIVVCCTWGKKISKEQLSILKKKGVSRVILMYDPDAIQDSKKYSFELLNSFSDVKVCFLKEKDPGDLTSIEFEQIFNDKQTPQDFFASRLQKRQL